MRIDSRHKPNAVVVSGPAFLFQFVPNGLVVEVVEKIPENGVDWVILSDSRKYLVYGTSHDDLTVEPLEA